MPSDLSLTKWYLDCVDDAGRLCIAYWARLAWRGISIAYSSVLFDGATDEHLFAVAPPSIDGDTLTWSAAPLQLDIAMERRTPAFETALIDGVQWRCLMPSADARIRRRDRELRGCGYAEVLELTVAPWRLPIDELRWGRFTGAGSLVWIEWLGEHPLTLYIADGVRIDPADVTLTIDEKRVVRDATLGETLAFIRRLLPKRIVDTRETKWCGQATLQRGDNADRGVVVYETVRFA